MDEIIQNYKKVMLSWGDFQGRARRREYWFFALAQFGVMIIAMIIDNVLFHKGTGLFYGLATLIQFVPSLAVSFRRLHDIGKSAWWLLICLIPIIGALVLLYFLIKDSEADNQYGPNPKTIA